MAKIPIFSRVSIFYLTFRYSNVLDVYIILMKNFIGNPFLALSKHQTKLVRSYELSTKMKWSKTTFLLIANTLLVFSNKLVRKQIM